jgi:hypothetical protein
MTIPPNIEQEINDTLANSVPEELLGKEMPTEKTEKYDAHTLEMLKRGISGGLDQLKEAMTSFEVEGSNWSDPGYVEVSKMLLAVEKTLFNMKELSALLENDLINIIKNIEEQALGQWTAQAHLQTLIETLKLNAVVTDEELETTWNKIVPSLLNKEES